jgi:hypothetical protein
MFLLVGIFLSSDDVCVDAGGVDTLGPEAASTGHAHTSGSTASVGYTLG